MFHVLTVVVTNAISDIYPQTADFTFYGGLYRDVNFIEVNEAHFDLFPVGGADAIAVEIKDAEGNVVGRGGAPAVNHTDLLISVKEPHKWHGMEDPYCYTAVAKLLAGEEVGADNEPLRKNLRDVNDIAKSMDPSRMTTIAQVSSTPMDLQQSVSR